MLYVASESQASDPSLVAGEAGLPPISEATEFASTFLPHYLDPALWERRELSRYWAVVPQGGSHDDLLLALWNGRGEAQGGPTLRGSAAVRAFSAQLLAAVRLPEGAVSRLFLIGTDQRAHDPDDQKIGLGYRFGLHRGELLLDYGWTVSADPQTLLGSEVGPGSRMTAMRLSAAEVIRDLRAGLALRHARPPRRHFVPAVVRWRWSGEGLRGIWENEQAETCERQLPPAAAKRLRFLLERRQLHVLALPHQETLSLESSFPPLAGNSPLLVLRAWTGGVLAQGLPGHLPNPPSLLARICRLQAASSLTHCLCMNHRPWAGETTSVLLEPGSSPGKHESRHERRPCSNDREQAYLVKKESTIIHSDQQPVSAETAREDGGVLVVGRHQMAALDESDDHRRAHLEALGHIVPRRRTTAATAIVSQTTRRIRGTATS